jgi:hypothetical protein
MLGDSDDFSVVFPTDANKEDRALLMCATLFLDYRYFEEKGQNQNR